MAFSRIRSLRAKRSSRRSNASPQVIPSPPEPVTESPAVDEKLSIKEISIDTSEKNEESIDEDPLPPFEYSRVEHLQNMFLYDCGIANSILSLTSELWGNINNPTNGEDKEAPQSPTFLKVNKVNQKKSEIVAPLGDKKSVGSLSRDVSDVEEVQQEQQNGKSIKQLKHKSGQQKPGTKENNRKEKSATVKTLHLHVGPLEQNVHSNNTGESTQSESSDETSKIEHTHMPKFPTPKACLPMRAGRKKSNDRQQSSRGNTRLPAANRARISRLPVRAGRVGRYHEQKAASVRPTETGRTVSRNTLIERRRCLIAATKNQDQLTTPPREGKGCIYDTALQQNASDNHDQTEACKSKMRRGETNTTKGTACSQETLEETFEETFEYDSEESFPAYENEDADDRITKAGWITRQLYREGIRDQMAGVENIELVYTLD